MNNHCILNNILQARGLSEFPKGEPLWKLNLSHEEYGALREVLHNNRGRLNLFPLESAICYAEWWRNDYREAIPSKTMVACGLGLPEETSDALFKAGLKGLKQLGINIIRGRHNTQYFRTLLIQGGLPVGYLTNSDNNLGYFTRFLRELVNELSQINYDWEGDDVNVIENLTCITNLPSSFRNETIYDIALQTAQAIIKNEDGLLPYANSGDVLTRLTQSLRDDYATAVEARNRRRTLRLRWNLTIDRDGVGALFVLMDNIKDIHSNLIPRLDWTDCSAFDIFIDNVLVGQFIRKKLTVDESGETDGAVYTRISAATSKEVLWKGKPMVEVKVRCDNGSRIFLEIPGIYPPDFDEPQIFQQLRAGTYALRSASGSSDNIVVCSSESKWKIPQSVPLQLGRLSLEYAQFHQKIELRNAVTGDEMVVSNRFTPYAVSYTGNYIHWVEGSNFKLITRMPRIRVYDESNNLVTCTYWFKSGRESSWRRASSGSELPLGLVRIKVVFPDGAYRVEKFYNLGDMRIEASDATLDSVVLSCFYRNRFNAVIEKSEFFRVEPHEPSYGYDKSWRIMRAGAGRCNDTCTIRVYYEAMPTLKLIVELPFKGIQFSHVNGTLLNKGQIVSLSDLSHYKLGVHGYPRTRLNLSYQSEHRDYRGGLRQFTVDCRLGLSVLSDYSSLVHRMFNLYGVNSFDRSSGVVLTVRDKSVLVRRFTLEARMIDGMVKILSTETDTNTEIRYQGSLYAISVDRPMTWESLEPKELIQDNENPNLFHFPEDYQCRKVILFSGVDATRRIIPIYFDRHVGHMDRVERERHTDNVIAEWKGLLTTRSIEDEAWGAMCRSFCICSTYDLPFKTFDGFKALSRNPALIVKFILAMRVNKRGETLLQDVESFEEELSIAIHWIPKEMWQAVIEKEIFNNAWPEFVRNLYIDALKGLLTELINITVSYSIGEELSRYLICNVCSAEQGFNNQDINKFRGQIQGSLPDLGHEYALGNTRVKGRYISFRGLPSLHRDMLVCAMCAAENAANVDGRTDLFARDSVDNARIVNFYRRFCRQTYSEVFIRTLRMIINKR